jgi:hypothetical protein
LAADRAVRADLVAAVDLAVVDLAGARVVLVEGVAAVVLAGRVDRALRMHKAAEAAEEAVVAGREVRVVEVVNEAGPVVGRAAPVAVVADLAGEVVVDRVVVVRE